MLALRTGWTPDVIGELPVVFRAACHWALYVETRVGRDGLEPLPASMKGLGDSQRIAVQAMRAERADLYTVLYPEDDDG